MLGKYLRLWFYYEPAHWKETPTQKQVKIAYDNKAIYVAAMLFLRIPIVSCTNLQSRWRLNADFFRFVIDPYNLRQDAFDFESMLPAYKRIQNLLTRLLMQCGRAPLKIQSQRLECKMKIPYSAIRFPKNQFRMGLSTRVLKETRSLINGHAYSIHSRKFPGILGSHQGIQDIQSPPRLSITPYASGYFERSPDYALGNRYHYSNSVSYNISSDLKYGIDDRLH